MKLVMSRFTLAVMFFSLILLLGILTGCSAGSFVSQPVYGVASLEELPADVLDAPVLVQQAYQFAFANPEILTQIPCYCGCGAMGHTSNYACYVREVDADGSIAYDAHALGCSICVDITQDTMRLLKEGKSPAEIRAYVNEAYAWYGPSNMP